MTDCVFYSYFLTLWKIEAFSLCMFLLLPNLREVPHGMKGTGPKLITRPVYSRSQLRNNTNTVSVLVLLMHLFHTLYTRYAGIAHHRVLQTSGRGWADSKAVHGMECSGGAHALLEVPLRGLLPVVYHTASTGRCAHPLVRMLNKPMNYQQQQTPGPVPGRYIKLVTLCVTSQWEQVT